MKQAELLLSTSVVSLTFTPCNSIQQLNNYSLMNIRDYLYLYLGCEVEYTEKTTMGEDVRRGKMVGVDDDCIIINPIRINGLDTHTKIRRRIGFFNLILRKFWVKYLTNEERDALQNAGLIADLSFTNICHNPETVRIACKYGFDIFNLIDSGMAIDFVKLLNKDLYAQVSDTTGVDSSNADGNPKIPSIDWEGLESACEHWCHMEFKEPPCPAKVMAWLRTNINNYIK